MKGLETLASTSPLPSAGKELFLFIQSLGRPGPSLVLIFAAVAQRNLAWAALCVRRQRMRPRDLPLRGRARL